MTNELGRPSASATDEELLARYHTTMQTRWQRSVVDTSTTYWPCRPTPRRSLKGMPTTSCSSFLNFHKHRKEYRANLHPACSSRCQTLQRHAPEIRYGQETRSSVDVPLRESDADSKADPSKHAEGWTRQALGTLPRPGRRHPALRIDGHTLDRRRTARRATKTVHKRAERGINTLRDGHPRMTPLTSMIAPMIAPTTEPMTVVVNAAIPPTTC